MFIQRLIRSATALALIAVPATVTWTSEGWSQADTIVVTTRKREENLQAVPISVDVINRGSIERQGVTGLEDIVKFSPSFIVSERSTQDAITITVRGLQSTRGRSNVAFLIDGIDVTSESFGAGASLMVSQRLLTDIQRIEAVKGPQSALYGRAAFAGAINYVTRDAPDEFESQVGFEIAEYDEYSVNGSVGGPVTDNLGVLVNSFYWDEEGQYSNSISGSDVGGGNGWGGSVTVNFDPTEAISLKGRLEYTDEEFNPRPQARLLADTFLTSADLPMGTPPAIVAEAIAEGGHMFVSNYGDADGAVIRQSESILTGEDNEGNTLEMFRGSLVASWDVDALRGTLTSYTSYVDSTVTDNNTRDGFAIGRPDMAIGEFWTNEDRDTQIFSQEIRYQSDFDGPFQFTLGGNYWTSERTQVQQGILGNGCSFLSVLLFRACATPPIFTAVPWQDVFQGLIDGGNLHHQQPLNVDDDHWSVYAMVEWDITDKWKLTLENRYSEDEQTVDRAVLNATDNATGAAIQFSETCGTFAGSSCNTVATAETLGFGAIGVRGATVVGTGRRSDTVKSSYNTPKGTLEFTPNEDLLFFASVARSQKPAGITLGGGASGGPFGIDEQSFESEKMLAYEIGAKTNWSGGFGDLRLNGSAFFQDYSDKQTTVRVRVPDGSTNRRTLNAASVEIWGFELDAVWQTPVEGLTLAAAYTWLDSQFIDFTNVVDDARSVNLAGNCTPEAGPDLVLGTADDECIVSFAGNDVEGAPEHAFSAAASFTRPLPFGSAPINWFVEGDAQYLSERFTDPDNRQIFDDYWKVNLRFGLEGDNWEALVFVDNLNGDSTIQSGASIPDGAMILSPITGVTSIDIGVLPRKRQFGFRAKIKF